MKGEVKMLVLENSLRSLTVRNCLSNDIWEDGIKINDNLTREIVDRKRTCYT